MPDESPMSFLEIVLLAIGLSMDAFAVACARGFAAPRVRIRDATLVGVFFGGAQAIMPAIGWVLGDSFASRMAGWGHWVTAVLLGGLGLKMIHEAFATDDDDASKPDVHPFGLKALALLAVATSIDALAAGVTIAARKAPPLLTCTTIGVITAVLSFAGVYLGHKFGSRLGKRMDAVGGIVLIALAIKTLLTHFGVV